MAHLTRSLLSIRPIAPQDLTDARRLQRQERWNQTTADWELFLRENPDGCFAAVVREGADADESAPGATVSNASIVGTVTSIRYGADVCWISMLLVDDRWRGHGIGTRLMERAIAANEQACACLRLDATPAGRPVYERLGFRVDYDVQRWMARSPIRPSAVPHACHPLDSRGFAAVRAFDHAAFGADRTAVLEHLRRVSAESAWTAGKDGLHAGYVLGRHGEHSHHIGPLVANDEGVAVDLLSAVLTAVGDQSVTIDVAAPVPDFARHLSETGFTVQRRFTRMSRGAPVREDPGRVVAIAGPEFG